LLSFSQARGKGIMGRLIQEDRQQQWPGVALSKSNASSDQVEAAQSEAPAEPTVIWGE